MLATLDEISKNLRAYKICTNCQCINAVTNKHCVTCGGYNFNDMSVHEIQEWIDDNSEDTLIEV